MRLAPLVPKPKPSDSGKRKTRQRPFTSYVPPQRSWESPSNQPFDSTKTPSGYGLASGIMAKLEVGDANDPLEREADAIADRVLRMPAPSREASAGLTPETDAEVDGDVEDEDEELSEAPTVGSLAGAAEIRRACASCDAKEDDEIMRKPAAGSGHGSTTSDGVAGHRWGAWPTPSGEPNFLQSRPKFAFRHPNSFDDPAADTQASWLIARQHPLRNYLSFRTAGAPTRSSAFAGTPQRSLLESESCEHRPRSWVTDWSVQRKYETCADKQAIRRACAACDLEGDEETLPEPAAGWLGGTASGAFAGRLRERLRSGGRPLPDSARNFLEPRLDVNLGRLRVHDDAAADELAGRINARAFTIGEDIFFGSGELKPSSQAGMRLLAHEVAHTLQSFGYAQTEQEAGGQPAVDSTVMSFSEQFAEARRSGGQALAPALHAPLKRSTPTLRRAPPEAEQISGEQPSVDYGEDFLEQSEKTQKLVRLTRHHLLNMIRDFTRPSKELDEETGEYEVIPSELELFGVPKNIRGPAERAAKRFVLVTEYLDSSSDRSAVLMSQWLDAAAELIATLQTCVRWIIKHGGELGQLIGAPYKRRLAVLEDRVLDLSQLGFFEEGAKLEETAREVEEAEYINEEMAQLEATLTQQIADLRREYEVDWMSRSSEDIEAELAKLRLELMVGESRVYFGDAAQRSVAQWELRVLQTKIGVLSGLVGELDFVAGPTASERAQMLAKSVMSSVENGATTIARAIEAGIDGRKVDYFAIETVLDAFRWIDFWDQATTKTERLAPEVLMALRDPAATLTALSGHARGKILIEWLSPPRRPELQFAIRVIWADPGEGGGSLSSPEEALFQLMKLGKAGRAHAVKAATSMLAKSNALERYARFPDTQHLLIEMVYQLWSDRFAYGLVGTGDMLADAVAGVSRKIRTTIPVVGSLHADRVSGSDDFMMSLGLRDYADAKQLGADPKTVNKMWLDRGVRIKPTDSVILVNDEGRVAIPALKLIEVGAKADRGMFGANMQDFARWSSEAAREAGEALEERAKARLQWLEGLVDDSADAARNSAREHLEGEDLERVEAVIKALEHVGDATIMAVTAAEGLRVGMQKGAINTVGDLAALGGNAAAGVAELGSDALDGEMLSDLAIEYDHFDHQVRVTVDAAPEVASKFYDSAMKKLEAADTGEKVFIVSDVAGQIVFEIALEFVGGGASKVGNVDDIADAARLVDALDELGDTARLSDRARELDLQGLRRSADHFDAVDSGVRRPVGDSLADAVKADVPGGTKVWVDQNLAVGTVIVEFDMPGGIVDASTIRIVSGPDPSPSFIRLHGRTVTELQRFSGWQGHLRKLLDRIKDLLKGATGEHRQALMEARLEVKKLQRIVEYDLRRLAEAKPGSERARSAAADLEDSWSQLDDWERVVDGDISPGQAKGDIAAKRNKQAKKPSPKLSSPNPVPKVIRHQYEEIALGNGTPRINPRTGTQTVFEARHVHGFSVWRGSLEFDVPGTSHRILRRPDGRYGYVLKHDYTRPRLFPSPWYSDGGSL